MRRVAEANYDAILRYAPQGTTLAEFHQSDAFVRALIGPLGSGKTQSCIVELIGRIHRQTPDRQGVRRSRWAVTRNTYVDLQSTTIKDWREVVDPLELGRFVGGSSPQQQIHYARTDGTTVQAEVMFLAFDRSEDVRKIRGLQLTGAWLNELKELNKAVVDMILARIGRFPPKSQVPEYWFGAIADSNAPARDHWLGDMALELKPEEWWFGIQPGAVEKVAGAWRLNRKAENLANLPERYYERQISAHSEDWIRANLGNEFILVIDGRPVHPDFSQSQHVAGADLEPTPGRDLVLGFDFGRTPACVILQQQVDSQWYVIDEVVTVNTAADRLGAAVAALLAEKYEAFHVTGYGDPAGSQMAQTRDETPFMLLEENGVYAWPAPDNDLELRIASLDRPLRRMLGGQPGILVSPRCKTLIRGLAGAYQFRRVQAAGGDRYHDKPDKGPESHVVEALHYALYGSGEADAVHGGWNAEMASIEDDPDFTGWAPDTGIGGWR
jgi:hypothetical protein